MMRRSQRYLFVTWDGGGNLGPALALARVLAQRGHSIAFLGHEAQRARIRRAGFVSAAFAGSPFWEARAPLPLQPRLSDEVTYQPAIVDDVRAQIDVAQPDVVVIDNMLVGGLIAAEVSNLRSAVLVHTIPHYFTHGPHWPTRLPTVNALRAKFGLPAVETIDEAWQRAGLVIVAALRCFDPRTEPLTDLHFVGPLFEEASDARALAPSRATKRADALALVSLTTFYHRAKVETLQRIVDGLSPLDMRVLVTAADVKPDDLRLSAKAELAAFIPHHEVLPSVSLVVTHGGHGTTLAALAHGVPVLMLPMFGDQRMVAERVVELDAGRALPLDADPSQIREAAEELLSVRSYRRAARELAADIRRQNSATRGADLLESLVPDSSGFVGLAESPKGE